jgi:hypothetical protein
LKSNDFDQVIKRVFIMIWPWHPLITLIWIRTSSRPDCDAGHNGFSRNKSWKERLYLFLCQSVLVIMNLLLLWKSIM